MEAYKMMTTEGKASITKMGDSLVIKEICAVCYTSRESIEVLNGELSQARKRFFSKGRKTVKVSSADMSKGFEGKLKGKIAKHSFAWKKVAGGIVLEEAMSAKAGSVLVMRNYNNFVTARVFFDKEQAWTKSEYFDPTDSANPQIILKPSDTQNSIEKFDYNRESKLYESEVLHPAPFMIGTAEQSVLNSRFGEPQVIVRMLDELSCYCPADEAKARLEALSEINEGTIVLMPAWEVKEGSVNADDAPEDDGNVTFTSLEEYARVTPENNSADDGKPVQTMEEGEIFPAAAEDSAGLENIPAEDFTSEESEEAVEAKDEPASTEPADTLKEGLTTEAILAAAMKATMGATARTPEPVELPVAETMEQPTLEKAALGSSELERVRSIMTPEGTLAADISAEEIENDIENVEEAESAETLKETSAPPVAAFEKFSGEDAETAALTKREHMAIIDGKLSGRGRTEQENGLTAYEGEYKDGKREGFGSYYYKDGKLCYAGNWADDKKEGLGVSFRNSDGALHIANWSANKPGDFVSLFDVDGNLRYGGRIIDGEKQGVGVSYNSENGTVFIGKWKDNEATGYGSVFDEDGSLLYTGMWADGKRNGSGTQFDEHGEIVFSGEWKDDKHHNGILYKKPEAAEQNDESEEY